MNCKGCGKSISKTDYKKVADWTFCPNCFDDLMNPSKQKPTPADTAYLYKKDVPEKKIKPNTCRICEAEIEKGNEKKLGIWTLCESCHTDLTFKTEKKPIPEVPDETQTDEAQTDKTQEDTKEEISEITDQGRININQTISCSSCGRTILAVAAKADGDHSFCPDCFYNENRGKL